MSADKGGSRLTVTASSPLIAILNWADRLAIDDFGTGCSTIASLRNLRVDRIKIDRSFVTGITERDGERILVQAILGIGQSLGIEVIAEGVETIADALMMQSLGCRLAQGFLYGEPISTDAMRAGLVPDSGKPADMIVAIGR